MNFKFAAQLYTLRNELKKDFHGVLWKLKRMGWDGVQIDGLHGYSAKNIAKTLKEIKLQTAGMHVPLKRIVNDLDTVLEEAKLFDTKDIICPYIDEHLHNEEGFKKVKKHLEEAAKTVKPLGYRISYHNDDSYDFQYTVEGKVALEYLLTPQKERLIYPELDTFWIKYSGYDPLKIIKKYKNAMPMIHLKDMSSDNKNMFTEIGEGQIDFQPILSWGEKNGVEWYIVEQDKCDVNPFESLEISLNNLINMAKL